MSLLSKEYLDNLARFPNDFDCLPFSLQVEQFVGILRKEGCFSFTAKDISDLFQTAQMKSPRSGRTITCSPHKAQECLERLIQQGRLGLLSPSPGVYEFPGPSA